MRLISHLEQSQRALSSAIRAGSRSIGSLSRISAFFFSTRARIGLCRSIVSIAALSIALSAHADQDGPYDPDFGSVGRTWIDITSSLNDAAVKVLRLPNGNLFLAGKCGTTSCGAWLTPAGALASGYGTFGTGTAWYKDFLDWPGDAFNTNDAAVLPDGRVAVVVRSTTGAYLVLIKADGSGLDSSIGNGIGWVPVPFYARLVRLTSQGNFIVAGITTGAPQQVVVARYDSTFHVDTAFGTGGSTIFGFTHDFPLARGMTLQRDGKIVVIGDSQSSTSAVFMARLTAGGDLDPDFGPSSNGKWENSFGASSLGCWGTSIVEDKQGRLVFGGYAQTAAGANWLVGRLLSGGASDPAFNGGHAQQFSIFSTVGNGQHVNSVALQSDNRIVASGTMWRASGAFYFAVARFNVDGSFDSTWGNGGQSYGDMSTQAPDARSDDPASMVIMPGGIVIGGSTELNGGESRFVATKLRTDLLFANDFE
ncbi:MAG TPA: hypothetical protein VLC97_16960 [Rhodanobacteraceae bacterium]|nr:hypothetical protein [Rhodanobacteraceae bacterium]